MVYPPRFTEGIADLSNGHPGAHRVHYQWHELAIHTRSLSQTLDRRAALLVVSTGAGGPYAVPLMGR